MNETATQTSPAALGNGPASIPDAGDLMAVVEHYQTPLLRYVGRLLGRTDNESEDIVQETFIRLHKQVKGRGAHSIKHLPAWLFRVAHNQTLDVLRKRARQQQHMPQNRADAEVLAPQEIADEMDALGEVLRQEARQVALRELAQLEEQQRQVLLLKIIQGMSLRQVAEVVGVSLSAVNYRLNQGLAELARRLRRAGVV
jgi:RNA polymerase sigma-70 factor (ECF subfamily)